MKYLPDFLISRDEKNTRTMMCAGVIVSLLLIICCWCAGPLPQLLAGHDIFVMLEGAWKWKWGIMPHHDYYSPFGALTYLPVYLGLEMTGSIVNAMPAAMCLFAIFILPPCVYLTFTRLPPFIAMIATVSLMATGLASHQLKFPSEFLTYCGIYNRWSYCVFLVAILAITVAPHKKAKWSDVLDGLIAGLFIVIAIFLKISFGLLLVTAFFGYIFFIRRKPAYYVAALAAFLLGMLGCGLLIKWDFAAFVHDMYLAAHARSGLGLNGMCMTFFFLYSGIDLLAILTLVACLIPRLFNHDDVKSGFWRIMVLAGGYVFYAVAIMMSNAPPGFLPESPVLDFGCLVMLGEIIRLCEVKPDAVIKLKVPKLDNLLELGIAALVILVPLGITLQIFPGGRELFKRDGVLLAIALGSWWLVAFLLRKYPRSGPDLAIAGSCAIMCFLVLPVAMRNIRAISISLGYKLHGATLPQEQIFQTGNLKGLQISDFGNDPPIPTTYVGKVMDGLDLINRTGNSGKPVASLDVSNPFNVAQGIKPAIGCPTGWHLHFLFSENAAPDPEQVFNGAQVVMLPKVFGSGVQYSLTVLDKHYGKYLTTHFTMVDQSDQWWILVRK